MSPKTTRSARRTVALAVTIALAASCTSSARPRGGSTGSPSASGALAERLSIRPAEFALRAPLEREVAVSLDNVIYLAGGLGTAGTSANGVFSLNPSNGALVELGSVPEAFHDAAGAVLGGMLFVFGGGTGESSDHVQSFDLRARRGAIAGHLPHPLSDLAAATAGGAVYLFGGWDGTTWNSTVWKTTDGRRFEVAGRLPQGLRYAAVAAVGANVVVAGGVDSRGAPVDTVIDFDTRTGRTSSIGLLPVPVGHAAAFALGGKVYVCGGTDAAGSAVGQVVAVDVGHRRVERVPSMRSGDSDAAAVVSAGAGWIIGGHRSSPLSQILRATIVRAVAAPSSPTASSDPATVRPFAGLLLVADRGNDRLLVLDANRRIVWRYPDQNLPAPSFRFYFPDDAFWVHRGHAILVSEEENDVIEEIAYPSGRVVWSAGHPGVPGAGPDSLSQPDDAYPAPGGGAMVADAKNCRIVFFDSNGRFARQVGRTGNADVPGSCVHRLPDHIGYPNGDTPLPNGHFLISELRDGGWIDEVDSNGHPIWQRHVPGVTLPSDPQRFPDGTFLTVDYQTPGRIVRFTSSGRVVWEYFITHGHGELANPSLAAPLPNGLIGVNDDFHDRMILIDPASRKIVWQYGHDDHPGTAHGYLNTPDGFDLLLPGGVTPLHIDVASGQVVQGRP